MKEKYKRISWKQYDAIIRKLSRQIQLFDTTMDYDGVYGIPRGGLVPAVSLSHSLQLPLLMAPTERTIVVDDIYDTGTSLKAVRHAKIKVALCYNDKLHRKKPEGVLVGTKTDGLWVIFSWETAKSTM